MLYSDLHKNYIHNYKDKNIQKFTQTKHIQQKNEGCTKVCLVINTHSVFYGFKRGKKGLVRL